MERITLDGPVPESRERSREANPRKQAAAQRPTMIALPGEILQVQMQS
jgi:hypothetical protein